jgi:hypothetical protein
MFLSSLSSYSWQGTFRDVKYIKGSFIRQMQKVITIFPVMCLAIFFDVDGMRFAYSYSYNLLPLNFKSFCQANLFPVSSWGKSYQAEIGKMGDILPASEGQKQTKKPVIYTQ